MNIRNYISPHVHQASLDSVTKPEDFAKREVDLGTGYTTVTDHGSLAAGRKVYDVAKENGLKSIIGLEAYFRDENDPIFHCHGIKKTYYDPKAEPEKAAQYPNGTYKDYLKYMHLTVHFMDQKAYECGVRLLSKADDRAERHGSERKPLFDWDNLEELGSYNVTFGSSCLVGMVSRHLLEHENLDTAIEYYEKLRSLVKPGNFIVEIFPHKCDKNWVEGTFITLDDGTTLKFHEKKWLRTNEGELQAKDLVREWAHKDTKHKYLLGIKNYSKWTDLPGTKIASVKYIEDFIENSGCEWAPDGDVQAGINRAMIEIANKYGDPLVLSCDAHYPNQENKLIQDVKLSQAGNWRFYGDYSRLSTQEAYDRLKDSLKLTEKEVEKWVDNSYQWASKFDNFEFKTEPSLPIKFYESKYSSYEWYNNIDKNDHSLMYALELVRKHGRMDWDNKEYVDRLEKEMELFHNNGIIDLLPYFFCIEEICEWCEKNAILMGCARGSSGGVLFSYLTNITHIDPIKYNLSLERFLTIERIKSGKLPDVDSDFSDREPLVNPDSGWLKKRFGDHFAQLSTDNTLKAKMAIKDVSRYLRGVVPDDIENLTKKIEVPPQGVDDYQFIMGYDTDAGYVTGSIEYDKPLIEYTNKYPKDWEVVKECVTETRGKGRHASAYIIANKPVHEFIPMMTVSDVKVTAYTANSVEAVGGIKYDLLSVNALNDINAAIELIQKDNPLNPKELGHEIVEHDEDLNGWKGPQFTDKRFSLILNGKRVPCNRLIPFKGKLYDIWDLPYDKATYADINYRKTETVFQLNTASAQQWLHQFEDKREDGTYSINSIEDIAAFTALDRPGPLKYYVTNPETGKKHNMLVEYARRVQGKTSSNDILPIFDELLPETKSIMFFQESMQKVYQELTGCTLAEAEEFRYNVGKKKKAKIEKSYAFFVEGASKKIGLENAKAVWEAFLTWSEFGFNKSHSIAYGLTAYATAFIKHNYPLQWWCAVLKNASKNEVNEKFWKYCGHLIDSPDLKFSGEYFEIQGDRIRAPISLLKGVGEKAHEQLMKYRPYTDIKDFCNKIEKHKIDTGHAIKKIQKKTKTTKDPITKEKKKEIIELEVDGFKKGHSSINRRVVYTLIISGALEGLFPKGTSFIDQMEAFEQALAEASGAKVSPIDPDYINLNQLQRYQYKKEILSAYCEDLPKLYHNMKVNNVTLNNGKYYYKYRGSMLRFIDYPEMELIENVGMPDGQPIRIAIGAYVEDSRNFNYQSGKEACELLLDIYGDRHKIVKWPDYKTGILSDIVKQPLKGALVVGILFKYKEERPFVLDDLIIIEQPRNKEKDEQAEQKNPSGNS